MYKTYLLALLVVFEFISKTVLPCELKSNIDYSFKNETTEIFEDFIKSKSDKRNYRFLKLKSGMKIVVISDETTSKSAACLSVNVGHMKNPPDIEGLAHFLEHLLFMGTEKYPEEDEYSKYVKEHSGFSNAFTTHLHTSFFFDIDPNYLYEALDRFANFFISPLFKKDCVNRELEAIESEHKKNLSNENCRFNRVIQIVSNHDHPFSKFATGNLETLKKDGIRDCVVDFYKKFYSAHFMCATVYGKESLDDLSEMAVKSFSNVPCNSSAPDTFESKQDLIFAPESHNTMIHIQSINELYAMKIIWQIPAIDKSDYKKKRRVLIGKLMSQTGEGEYVLGCSTGFEDYESFSFLIVLVSMTKAGWDNYKLIILHVLAYLDLIQKNISDLSVYHSENKVMNETMFGFQEKKSSSAWVQTVCRNMFDYSPDVLLNNSIIYEEYDEEFVRMFFHHVKKDNFILFRICKDLEDYPIEKEHFYDISYQKIPIDVETLNKFHNVSSEMFPDLKLPELNQFIPKSLEYFGKNLSWDLIQKYPNTLIDKRLYHKLDDYFGLPKTAVNILLRPNDDKIYSNIVDLILLRIFLLSMIKQGSEKTSAATAAGFNCTYKWAFDGFELHFSGFSDKIGIYIDLILKRLLNFIPDKNTFETVKDDFHRQTINEKNKSAFELSDVFLSILINFQSFSSFQILEILPTITFEMLEVFSKTFFKKYDFCFKMLCLGNIVEEKAIDLFETVKPLFSPASNEGLKAKFVTIKKESYDCFNFFMKIQNKNNASMIAIKVSNNKSLKDALVVDFFCQMFQQRFFNELRTVEQMGYVCSLDSESFYDAIILRFTVQSAVKDCGYVEKRILNFIQVYCKSYLDELSEEHFEVLRESLLVTYKKKWTNLSSEMNRYWPEILSGRCDFTSTEGVIALVNEIELEDLRAFYSSRVLEIAPENYLLSLWIVGEKFEGEKVSTDERNEISSEKYDYRNK